MTFKEEYGYPLWVPLAGISLMLGFAVSLIAALATADRRYLIVTVICYVILAAK